MAACCCLSDRIPVAPIERVHQVVCKTRVREDLVPGPYLERRQNLSSDKCFAGQSAVLWPDANGELKVTIGQLADRKGLQASGWSAPRMAFAS